MIEAVEALKNSGKVIVDEDHEWGYQLRFVNEAEYCGKLLVLNSTVAGSFHYHVKKKETFVILYGILYMKILRKNGEGKWVEVFRGLCYPGDEFTLDPLDRHCMKKPDNEYKCTVILEVSTHDDDFDTYSVGGKPNEK